MAADLAILEVNLSTAVWLESGRLLTGSAPIYAAGKLRSQILSAVRAAESGIG